MEAPTFKHVNLLEIDKFTEQEIFDDIANYLINVQKERCYDEENKQCMYKKVNSDGTINNCAIGYIIPVNQEEMLESIADFGDLVDVYSSVIPLKDSDEDANKYTLLKDLQIVHDAHWNTRKEELKVLAARYRLIWKFN